jgi:hypothetical protein
MDIQLRGVTLAFVLWYVLPGLNFLVINILLPLALLNPDKFADYSSVGSLIVLLGAALVVGFVMDSMKLYQFTRGYGKKKAMFFRDLGDKLSVSSDRAREIFNSIRGLASQNGSGSENLSLEHSRWVMMNHTAKCFYLLAATWLVILIIHNISPDTASYLGLSVYDDNAVLVIDSAIVIAVSLIGVRLSRMSSDHLALSNQGYLDFVARNSKLIRDKIIVEGIANHGEEIRQG